MHPVLTGADPSAPGQPQEQTPVGGPHAGVGLKPQLSPRGRTTKEEEQKSFWAQATNPCNQLGNPYIYGISEWTMSIPTNEGGLALAAVDFGD